MAMPLNTGGDVLDVQAVHDRVALVVAGQAVWLDAREVELLRQKLGLDARELTCGGCRCRNHGPAATTD